MKKKIWTVTPFFFVFTIGILCMAVFSLRWNIYVFGIEMTIALLSIVVVIFGMRTFTHHINRTVRQAAEKLGSENLDYLNQFNIPVVVTGSHDDVVWYNDCFKRIMCNGRDCAGDLINHYIPNTSAERILQSDGADVMYGERRYTVVGCALSEKTAVFYFVDDTYYKETTDEYMNSRPVVATVEFDNADEFEKDDDRQQSYIIVNVENVIQKWANKFSGLYKKLSNGRYMIIFEERVIDALTEDNFTVLEDIKQISLENVMCNPTISIGIGRCGENFRQCELWSRNALDMALGRGGDQVAIKTKDQYRFYGGNSQGFEKIDKVRTRVIAGSVVQHIKSSDHVLIMGHHNSDIDCIGTGIGLWSCITKDMKKPAHVVVKKDRTVAGSLITLMNEVGNGNMFMEPDEAIMTITEKTLLIIVDTHSPNFLEDVNIYNKASRIIVIDHHRMMVNRISNALVFFHEPYASSAAEMATELIQYMGDKGLTKHEAAALLAGITLDTKNFVLKTGVRTFEAAAYLRQKGADTVGVKRLFANSLDNYKSKFKLVAGAEIFNSCALACSDDESDEDMRVTAAQAADDLLSINSVTASFVMYKQDDVVCISARSLGDVNVQVIMEKLGGGGHHSMAGAQLKNVTMEQARAMLLEIIENNSDEENNDELNEIDQLEEEILEINEEKSTDNSMAEELI
ncbi:MAG: DHH family phosphoesterase [Acutalibacteraceae bacterium]|nr:DHH family phosphoesterase [Acutalibacteraceae bacterium]